MVETIQMALSRYLELLEDINQPFGKVEPNIKIFTLLFLKIDLYE
jgi:hypothetical protein